MLRHGAKVKSFGPGLVENFVSQEKWYKDGLKFTCTQCGNCCTGSTGYVWTTADERQAIAEFLGLEVNEFTERYARRVGTKYSLKEKGRRENWDCVFLINENGKRVCRIYPVRPRQCRTWPFWNENLEARSAWEAAGETCPGMNQDTHYNLTQIEIRRNDRS